MNCMSNLERYIYISYKWSQSSLVDLICDKLNSNGLLYKRDIKDCTLQDSITGFEEEIGRGDYIIVVLSDDYFESLGCMYEMACITENGKIGERVVFVDAMKDVKREFSFDVIIQKWKDRYDNLCDKQLTAPHIDELAIVDKIIRLFPDFWCALKDHIAYRGEQVFDDKAFVLVSHLHDKVKGMANKDITNRGNVGCQQTGKNIQMGDKSVFVENFSGTLNMN